MAEKKRRRPVRCYDNGGESYDRYTVIFTKRECDGWSYYYSFLGMSEHPFHPQGFGQHGEMFTIPDADEYDTGFGKRIPFSKLPPDCQKCVDQDLNYQPV